MLTLLIGFMGKYTHFIRAERPYIEQIFEIYHWNYELLAWKTWRQGRTHTRINWRRNCEKIWHVLNKHTLIVDRIVISCAIYSSATKLGRLQMVLLPKFSSQCTTRCSILFE